MSSNACAARMALPLAAVLGLGLAGGAEAANRGHGGTLPVARALAVQAPVAVAASERGRGGDGDRRKGRRSRVYVRPYYGSFGWYGGLGSFWPYAYSPHYYGYGPYGWGPGPVGYVGDAGALDINTRPKKASVYIDGELVGRVDGFDGFPRYLWLRDGSYRIAIFMEGYETLERQIRVQPGVVIRIDEDLVPGTAERPRPAPSRPAAAPPAPEGESWRVENRGRPIEQDQRRDPARLQVEVEPADAVVYLDGRLLGSGSELASLHSALIVDPGAHRLEVIRPGYVAEVRAFEATQGEDVVLRIVLRED
ncbi:MAG: PEGA domain-containing protein [Holophagales bacterium]|nr:PEGA domain-containing protein [Holophagales bacterium]MYJ25954.1 PEGA domain-containing protein [Holophagales bacterium]